MGIWGRRSRPHIPIFGLFLIFVTSCPNLGIYWLLFSWRSQPVAGQDAEEAEGQVNEVKGAGGKESLGEFFNGGKNQKGQNCDWNGKLSELGEAWEAARQEKSQNAIQDKMPSLVTAGEVVDGM